MKNVMVLITDIITFYSGSKKQMSVANVKQFMETTEWLDVLIRLSIKTTPRGMVTIPKVYTTKYKMYTIYA